MTAIFLHMWLLPLYGWHSQKHKTIKSHDESRPYLLKLPKEHAPDSTSGVSGQSEDIPRVQNSDCLGCLARALLEVVDVAHSIRPGPQ